MMIQVKTHTSLLQVVPKFSPTNELVSWHEITNLFEDLIKKGRAVKNICNLTDACFYFIDKFMVLSLHYGTSHQKVSAAFNLT